MNEKFPDLLKDWNPQIKEAQSILYGINKKKSKDRHIIIKPQSIKDKEILNVSQREKMETFKGRNYIEDWLLISNNERQKGMELFSKYWKEITIILKFYTWLNYFFKNEEKNNYPFRKTKSESLAQQTLTSRNSTEYKKY